MGVGAVPVVVLMSTIIGAIIAQQGAFQLRYFGADIFVVDLVGILVLREIGVLFDCDHDRRAFGQCDHRRDRLDEDARGDRCADRHRSQSGRRTGISAPCRAGDLPALLTIIADFAALGGAIGISWAYSEITPDAFIDRLRDAIDLSAIFAGLIKAPFMAMIIGIMASVEGMKVGGSAESLGQHVTASVVKSIFVVIVVDGIFAIFYASINF